MRQLRARARSRGRGGGPPSAPRGERALVVQADVSREEDIVAMFRTVDRSSGLIDALVNNAGIDYERLVADVDRAGVERVFGINRHRTDPVLAERPSAA